MATLSFKQKKKIIGDMNNPEFAETDLKLLRELSPGSGFLNRASRNPQRYYGEILSELVEKTAPETIRLHRRKYEDEKIKENENINPDNPGGTEDDPPTTETDNKTGDGTALITSDGNSSEGSVEGDQTGTKDVTSDLEDQLGPDSKGEEIETVQETPPEKNVQEEKPADPGPEEKKLQKEEEYPNIRWTDLHEQDIQFAVLIYNARINSHREMKALDQELDQEPTPEQVQRLAELRNENLLAFKELQSYNDTGKWLYEHPLIVHHSELERLRQLKQSNPEEFLKEHTNCAKNVARYRSYLKNETRKDKHESDRANLQKHLDRQLLFKTILES